MRVDKVHGAIDGIDDPRRIVGKVANDAVASGGRFFANEFVAWKNFPKKKYLYRLIVAYSSNTEMQ